MKTQRGFTIIEVMIAVIVLTVRVLGLVTAAALVTRMIARGQRSAVAATFAARRMERLRPAACIAAQRVAGSDTLYRGGTWVAISNWTFTDAGSKTYLVRLVTTYKTVKNRTRVETLETAIPCQT